MVAELAAAASVVAGVAGKMVPYLLNYLGKNHKLRANLKIQINSITDECEMISALIEEDTDRRQTSGNGTHKKWITMVRDLAYDIDDTINRFTRQMCVTLEPDASWIRRTVHRMTTRKARNKFAAEILRIKKKSGEVSQLKEKYSGTLQLEAPPAGTVTYTVNPVGMDTAREELMELIRESPQGQPEELRVISLVGFGGIGKSQLAKLAYDTTESEYPTRAWVTAAERSKEDVLKDILRQLGMDPTTISSSGGGAGDALCKSIKKCLVDKRFLIVIDDIGSQVWDGIRDAFPKVRGIRSRVIATTARHSIAKKCSHDSGAVYEMRTLDEHNSRQLLIEKASMDSENPPLASDIMRCSEAIKKCDGLPLALVTTGHLLQSICNRESWTYLCENLGQKLESNENFASMKRVLVRSYTSLGKQDVKTCLLYLGIYPSGRPIRRGSLIRRWLAEGFITDDRLDAAVVNFNVLVERSIIRQPVDANSAEMKTCQTHGMMLEFILHNTDNFVTLLGDKATLPSNARWLSLHASKSEMNPNKLRLVRSLTIFGEAHKSALDFSKYKLMRVLDLEECHEHLEDKHLKEICSNLLLLRYLSLRGAASITVLPKEIKKLHHLETLDVRRTNIEILPTEVMELPCLVHLFGKLKHQGGIGDQRISMLQTWLSENSKLKTVAGFVVDERQEMPQLIPHMEELTKMKIWCESTPDASINISHLSKAIKGFVERGTNLNKARSLSLNFNAGWTQDLLCFSLEKDKLYYLRSLKLQGNNICSQLPLFVTNLYGLTKLCLSFSGHNLSSDILDSLSKVRGLEFLKLIATQMDKLVIREGELESLQSLCIVVEVMTELVIGKGALQRLGSLQLLCKDLKGFSSTTIQSLPLLKEVALHDELSEPTKQEWKKEAKKHPRYPKVLCKLKGSEPAAGTSTAATATDTIAQEVAVESEPVENSENPAAPPTDMMLSVTTPPGAISTEESVQVVTSEIGSEPAAEIPVAPTIDITWSVTTPPGAIFTGEPVQFVTSETGSGSAAEISPVATTADKVAQEVAVESKLAENSKSPAAPPTDMMLSVGMTLSVAPNGESVVTSEMGSESAAIISAASTTTDNTTLSVNHNTFANTQEEYPVQVITYEMGSETAAEIPVALATTDNVMSMNHDTFAHAQEEYPVQVDGDGQHDDHETEDVDNTRGPNYFASENSPSTVMASVQKEMEGVAV